MLCRWWYIILILSNWASGIPKLNCSVDFVLQLTSTRTHSLSARDTRSNKKMLKNFELQVFSLKILSSFLFFFFQTVELHIQIADAETSSVKAMTTIGDRTYCEATPGKEFWVVVRVLDMNMHNKLNPTGEVFFPFNHTLMSTILTDLHFYIHLHAQNQKSWMCLWPSMESR